MRTFRCEHEISLSVQLQLNVCTLTIFSAAIFRFFCWKGQSSAGCLLWISLESLANFMQHVAILWHLLPLAWPRLAPRGPRPASLAILAHCNTFARRFLFNKKKRKIKTNWNDICGILNLASRSVCGNVHVRVVFIPSDDWPLNLCQVFFSLVLFFFNLIFFVYFLK